MKNRNEKQQDLDKLKTELAKVSTVILSTFQGITVEDDTKLRRAVQAAGGKYKVVKNTLAERAGAGTPAENLLKNLRERIRSPTPRRIPSRWPRRSPRLPKTCRRFSSSPAWSRAALFSIAEIQQLANLPSKEDLISKIMFLLNAPAQRVAMALNALPRNLAVTVSEAIKANKFGSGGGSAAPSPELSQ